MELLQENLRFVAVSNTFWERRNSIEEGLELREKTEERIHEIKKLKRKREVKLENLFVIDNELSDLSKELDADKKDRQEELVLTEIKLEKLKIPKKN